MDSGHGITRRKASVALVAGAASAWWPRVAPSQELRVTPPPRGDGGRPVMQALQSRRSTRAFAPRPLPVEVLSDLLWAAYGIKRSSGDRTAPYCRHLVVLDLYAAMADGVWLHEPKGHALRRHMAGDIRAQTGSQGFVATAPLNLIYVVQGERMEGVPAEERRLYGSVDAAFAGQNVYLYCASENLATVFRGAIDTLTLGRTLGLSAGAFVAFAQTVGYPAS